MNPWLARRCPRDGASSINCAGGNGPARFGALTVGAPDACSRPVRSGCGEHSNHPPRAAWSRCSCAVEIALPVQPRDSPSLTSSPEPKHSRARLSSLAPPSALIGHVYLGFSLCGRYVLSYSKTPVPAAAGDEDVAGTRSQFALHWWPYHTVGRPFGGAARTELLFGGRGLVGQLYITVSQQTQGRWVPPTPPPPLLVGSAASWTPWRSLMINTSATTDRGCCSASRRRPPSSPLPGRICPHDPPLFPYTPTARAATSWSARRVCRRSQARRPARRLLP